MGVKTVLTLMELPKHFSCTTLVPTSHGVSDTVYITDKGVLKVFETASIEAVYEERDLLNKLKPLPIPAPLGEVFTLRGKPSALYETLRGESLKRPDARHILQIARFMRDFHTLSAGKKSSNVPLFEPSRLEAMIKQSGSPELLRFFGSIDLRMSNDGVIHGDLFLDNALFEEDRLTGVFDFIEACEGDFLFDLAVVAASWCLEELPSLGHVTLLLKHYGTDTGLDDFLPYMRYALLYYATTRYSSGRDYRNLLEKIYALEEIR